MAELVGVVSPRYRARTLKRELMLFDRIGFVLFREELPRMRARSTSAHSKGFADEVEYLADKGLVFDPFTNIDNQAEVPLEAEQLIKVATDRRDALRALLEDKNSNGEGGRRHISQQAVGLLLDSERFAARGCAIVAREMGWDPLESTCRHASLSIL